MSGMSERDLSEVWPTLEEETVRIIEGAMAGSKYFFQEEGEVPSVIIGYTGQGEPRPYPAIHRNAAEKQIVWAFLRFVRRTHPITVMVTEAWISMLHGKDVDPEHYIPPSQDPNRLEAVLITVWERDRHLMISAPITRNPNRLGEFKVRLDSRNEGEAFEGEIFRGESYPRKERRYEP